MRAGRVRSLLGCTALLCALLLAPLRAQEGQAQGNTRWFQWSAPAGMADVAGRLSAEADAMLEEIHRQLRLGPPRRGVLVWVRDREGIAAELGHPVPEWFAAVALPLQGRMVVATRIAGGEARLRATLRHEMVHHAMGALGAEAFTALPSWFHEGCAEYYSGEIYLGGVGISLSWRAASGSLPPLSDFDQGFGEHPVEAAEGYALAHAFVERLVRGSGPQAVPDVLQLVREGSTLDQALVASTGLALVTHEELMRSELTSLRQLLRDFYPHLMTTLFLLALLLFPFVRRARRRRELELQRRWRQQEEEAAAAAAALSAQAEAMQAWMDENQARPPGS